MLLLRFNDFSCGDTACADLGSLNRSLEIDLDLLKIREETTQSLSDNLRTGTARSFDLTASFIFYAWDSAFLTDCTYFCHD